ncbi:hypothetical protein [Lutibacter citreus]|uniref:hypothetical protein n=1 Tax=Lutibacter citreus TaxID=2138210 RepID=UPI001FE8E5AC|nr:hypothetical protein [Lutibacter citreus]
MVDIDFFNQKSVHFKSKSGSSYFYTKEGVYRYSNHWGRVANCRWKINDVKEYKNQNYYVGYANWGDFYSINTNEKLFYIDVVENNPQLFVCDKAESSKHFLMTLEFAIKRIKQIKELYKDYKWAIYYNENIDVLRTKLVYKLVNSEESIQVIKREVNN